MTDHADLVARLRARARRGPLYRDADAALDREAAAALSAPAVTEALRRAISYLRELDGDIERNGAPWMLETEALPGSVADELDAILTAALGEPAFRSGRVEIAHDGFAGDIIGHYTTREGKRGVVIQQDGTRVVHVYGEKWLTPAAEPRHETYPGHDPAAGLPQPATEKGGDANSDGSLDHGPDNAKPRSPDTAGGAEPSLRAANLRRQAEWDPSDKITAAYRGNELAGEVGEACNVIKKLEDDR